MRSVAVFAGLAAVLAVIACTPAPGTTGKALYGEHCTACHGSDARGDGPRARDVGRPVPDLTRIAARNGGAFPMAAVMSQIDGYTRAEQGDLAMPEFGAAMRDSPVIAYDSGDGIETPTPAYLVALAEYLRSIQRLP